MTFVRFTMAMQLVGFIAWGWIVGGLAEYKIQKQNEWMTQVVLTVPVGKLSEIEL